MREAFEKACPALSMGSRALAHPQPDHDPFANQTEIFLCHGRLYAFADSKGIDALRQLVLDEVYNKLAIFNLYLSGVKNIVALVEYLNANTPSRK